MCVGQFFFQIWGKLLRARLGLMFLKRPNTEKDVSFPFLKNVKFRSIIIRFVMHYF